MINTKMPNFITNWDKTLEILREELNDTMFDTWIAPLVPKKMDNMSGTLYVEGENEYKIQRFNERYLQIANSAASIAFGHPVHIEASVAAAPPAVEVLPEDIEKLGPSADYSDYPDDELSQENYLNPRYNFGAFVVGENSKMAHAAALVIAQNPGKKNLNPFFLYGGSGVGKTHLMHAIGHYILKNSKKKVLYVTCEMFTNEFMSVISSDKGTRSSNWRKKFRDKYRKTDVLLIDDIEFLEGKEQTINEFFNTFEALIARNKQIVISSDRSPEQLKLDDRVTSRFMWGITADIQPPDFETRVAILLSKAEAENIEVTPEVRAVIELIAERIKKNVRELESSFTQVVTLAPLMGEQINVSFAKKTLKNMLRNQESVITIEGIKRAVCKYYNVKMQDMDSKKRMRAIAYPRQIAMYLSKELTDYSLPKIGESFGGRDHTTVLYACNKIREDMKMSAELRDDIDELKDILE